MGCNTYFLYGQIRLDQFVYRCLRALCYVKQRERVYYCVGLHGCRVTIAGGCEPNGYRSYAAMDPKLGEDVFNMMSACSIADE